MTAAAARRALPPSLLSLGRQLRPRAMEAAALNLTGGAARLSVFAAAAGGGWPRAAARLAAGGLAAGALGLPAAALAYLLVSGRGEADAAEVLRSVPRTLRVLYWSAWAAAKYAALAAAARAAASTDESRRSALEALHAEAARRLVAACQRNGGVYVKAGQLAGAVQAVPHAYRVALEGLEDRCTPRAFAAVDALVAAELGAPADVLFDDFARVPAAAASLAQVHAAALRGSGRRVAVKVQYPGLEAAVAADLATLAAVAALAARAFPGRADWRWLVAEVRAKLALELDFRHEAANSARLAACFAGRADVSVPAVITALSSRRVLVMEWADGAKVSDAAALRARGLAPRAVGLALTNFAAELMSVHGFVHGDLHPGNVFVAEAPRGGGPLGALLRLLPWAGAPRPRLVILDHGVYFELDRRLRQLYCQLWCAFVLNDAAEARAVATALGGARAGRALPAVLRPRDWARMSAAERRAARREAGVGGAAELARLAEDLPRPLFDCLRATAIVRHVAARLGVTVADRLRVNATWALRGLRDERGDDGAEGAAAGGGALRRRRRRRRVEWHGAMRSRWRRWHLHARLVAMRLAAWISLALSRSADVAGAAVPLVEASR
jgi:aarF domain-containing kinase